MMASTGKAGGEPGLQGVTQAAWRRRILLVVTGLTPQVVTETLYAMLQDGEALPSEIHLLTTAAGAERARLTLLSDEPGWLRRFFDEYGLQPIHFSCDDIRVLRDEAGRPLADIRRMEENALAADAIAAVVRELTSDPEASLHVSLAGGRKSMGFFAGYALSLFGRTQDRLSHVLVSAPFESHAEFFFPTRRSRVIYTHGPEGRPVDTRTAEVTLADIPFIRLRDLLDPSLLTGSASYGETVTRTRAALESPQLRIDPAARRLFCGGREVPLSPGNLAFYLWMAERARVGQPGVRGDERGLADQFLHHYRLVAGEFSGGVERADQALVDGMDGDFIQRHRSRVNRALKEALGPGPAKPYLVVGDGQRPRTRYRLALAQRQIVIMGREVN